MFSYKEIYYEEGKFDWEAYEKELYGE